MSLCVLLPFAYLVAQVAFNRAHKHRDKVDRVSALAPLCARTVCPARARFAVLRLARALATGFDALATLFSVTR